MTHQEIIPLLRDAEKSGYYGSIEIKYERGEIMVVKRSETLKPSDFQRDIREVQREQRCR